MAFIYGLRHPITKELRYVGKTSNRINDRLSTHLWLARNKGKKNLLYAWINGILKLELRPEIYLIEEVSDEKLSEREIYWIAYYRQAGFRLKNVQNGGDGQPKGYQFKKRHVPPKGVIPEQLKVYIGKNTQAMHSVIGREKRRQHRLGKRMPWSTKKIISRNINTNVEICFSALSDAAKFFNITSSQISMRCKNKTNTHINDTMFRFVDRDYLPPRSGQGYDKKVYIYKDNKLLHTFNTCSLASKFFKLNRKTISYRCKSDKLFDGYKWSYNAY